MRILGCGLRSELKKDAKMKTSAYAMAAAGRQDLKRSNHLWLHFVVKTPRTLTDFFSRLRLSFPSYFFLAFVTIFSYLFLIWE